MHLLACAYNKFFNPPKGDYSATDSPMGSNLNSWETAQDDSYTLSLLSDLSDAHNRVMARDQSPARQFATATAISCVMTTTVACIGIPETALRIGTTALTLALRKKSPDFLPIEVVAAEASKAFTSLTASLAGCILAYDCITRKENINVTTRLAQASLGLIDLRDPPEDDTAALPVPPQAPPHFIIRDLNPVITLENPADGG